MDVIYFNNQLLITPAQKEQIIKNGLSDYDTFDEYYWNPGYDTGLPHIVHLISFIENDYRLNERDNELRKRIKEKGYTLSQGSYTFVEEAMLMKLVWDAYYQYCKEFGGDHLQDDLTNRLMLKSKIELMRIYGIPYFDNNLMTKIGIYSLPFNTYTKKLKLTKGELSELEKKETITISRSTYLSTPNGTILHGNGKGYIFNKIEYHWVYGDIADFIDIKRNYGRRVTDYPNNNQNMWSGGHWWSLAKMDASEWNTKGLPYEITHSVITDIKDNHPIFELIVTKKK